MGHWTSVRVVGSVTRLLPPGLGESPSNSFPETVTRPDLVPSGISLRAFGFPSWGCKYLERFHSVWSVFLFVTLPDLRLLASKTERQKHVCHLKPPSKLSVFGSLKTLTSRVVLVVKYSAANAGDFRNAGSISGSGRFPGEGNGNPLQYYCLENPTDRGAWWAIVHGVAKSQTQPKWLSSTQDSNTCGNLCPWWPLSPSEVGSWGRRGLWGFFWSQQVTHRKLTSPKALMRS